MTMSLILENLLIRDDTPEDWSNEAPSCNGLCMTGNDIGVPSNEIAYPHPECEVHGK